MKMTNEQYKEYLKAKDPKSPIVKNMILAFVVGGAICVVGQLLFSLYEALALTEAQTKIAVSMTLITFSGLFTALGLYDNLAKHAGAGTLVPITGFANAIVSPAMEFRSEGLVLGVGARMFAVAGPVLVYGVVASIVYGVGYVLVCGAG